MRCTSYVAGVAALASLGCAAEGTRRIVITQETRVSVSSQNLGPDETPTARPATVTLFPAVPDRLDMQVAHRVLDGQGEWSEHPAVGLVWTPTIARAAGFVPYVSRGRWLYTRDGWYWQSDDPWGAVAFHYGRWLVHGDAWAWAPGATFAPAWVDWRSGGGWVGWSPRAPDGFDAQSPFAYCARDRLAGAGLWSRVVQGAAAVSLFAPTTMLDPARGYGGALYAFGPPGPAAGPAPSAQNVWAASLPPDTDFAPLTRVAAVEPRALRQTLTLGYSSEIRAVRTAGSSRVACASCGSGMAPVNMPPAADGTSGGSLVMGGGWRSYGRSSAGSAAAFSAPFGPGAPAYAPPVVVPMSFGGPSYTSTSVGGGSVGLTGGVRGGGHSGPVGVVAR